MTLPTYLSIVEYSNVEYHFENGKLILNSVMFSSKSTQIQIVCSFGYLIANEEIQYDDI